MDDELVLVIRTIVCVMMAFGTAKKLHVLHGNTRKWNGLGRAIRNEKWAYLVFWIWLGLGGFIDGINGTAGIIVMGSILFYTEVKATRTLPKVTVQHDDERDLRQNARDIRQEATDVRQERERRWIIRHK